MGDPCGIVYDFLELLYRLMNQYDLSKHPIYFISPVGKASIEYSSIFSEWLNTTYQSNVQQRRYPFLFQNLIKEHYLRSETKLSSQFYKERFQSPCIFIIQSPNLRFGSIVRLLNDFNNTK